MSRQKGFAPIVIILIVVALLGVVAVSTGKFKSNSNKSTSAPVASGWETYKNDQIGYSIQFPKGWVVKDQSGSDKKGVSVMQPENLANVLIIGTLDKGLKDKVTMESAIAARKEYKQTESGLKITGFDSQVEDKKGGWILVGEKTIDGKKWIVMERGLVDIYGKVLLEQSGYLEDGGKDYKDVITKILDSFRVE